MGASTKHQRSARGPFGDDVGAEHTFSDTRGFYIDITESFNADLQQSISEELQVIVSHREVIDQAKGMLMVIYQLSADAAFAVLKWRSQELNIKLSAVAEKVVAELPELLSTNRRCVRPSAATC